MVFDAVNVRGLNYLFKITEYLLFIRVKGKRVLTNLSALGVRAVSVEGGEARPRKRARGVKVLEKSRGLCAKSRGLEGKVTETLNPSSGS